MNSCSTCLYFFQPEKPAHLSEEEKAKLPAVGQCRVRAPSVGFVSLPKIDMQAGGMVPSLERATSFPSVHADVWCGEWAPKG